MQGGVSSSQAPYRAHQIVERARDPAIATDPLGRIAFWNSQARDLLEDREKGRGDDSQVLQEGRSLHGALRARDIFGNRLSPETNPLQLMLEEGEAIQGFEMDVSKASGAQARVGVSVVAVLGPEPDSCYLIHLLKERRRRRRSDELLDRLLAQQESDPGSEALRRGKDTELPQLTPREQQVLQKVADGRTNEQIAEELHISIHTVRRHFQNLMRKLGIHSKAEAVALAFRRRWV